MKTQEETKKRYILTDGHEVVKAAMFTETEYLESQYQADIYTDGNWYWIQDDNSPVTWIAYDKLDPYYKQS